MHATFTPALAVTFDELPGATWGYLSLYLATLVLHVVFMGYVLAGSSYLAVISTLRKSGARGPFEPLLREWLPLMLSLAITAGIAPLLFVQILYRPQFYTANLLLFHRWMAVLPVLIVGFYLLYLLKNRWGETRSRAVPMLIGVVTTACFAFVAWSWTENHLLSLAGQEVWSGQYVSQSLIYRSNQLLPRLAMWFCGTFAILAVWLSWQLWWPQRPGIVQGSAGARPAAALGLAGLVMASVCAGLYWMTMLDHHRAALSTSMMLVPWILLVLGGLGLTVLFAEQFRQGRLSRGRLSLLSTSLLSAITAVACLRESIRLHSIDVAALLAVHESAASVGGRWAFVSFLLINAVLIGWCLHVALRQSIGTGSDANRDSL